MIQYQIQTILHLDTGKCEWAIISKEKLSNGEIEGVVATGEADNIGDAYRAARTVYHIHCNSSYTCRRCQNAFTLRQGEITSTHMCDACAQSVIASLSKVDSNWLTILEMWGRIQK